MSDPVTNAEVEDVLSSIRRLVSEDKRPLHAQKAVPVNDRLVLTPALRVAAAPQDDTSQDDEILEDETFEIDPIDNAQDVVTLDKNSAVASVDESDTLFDDPAHDYETDPYNFEDEEDSDGEGHEALDLSGLEAEDSVSEEAGDHAEAELQVADDSNAAKAATLSAKIEALETAIGNISDTWEPDEPGADEYSGTRAPAMAWEDDIDRDAMGAPLNDDADRGEKPVKEAAEPQTTPGATLETPASENPSRADTTDDGFAYGADDQLIDEEALRDLVSDIVRSELQGALGERITRNVRKLVRREIHRALTAQELE